RNTHLGKFTNRRFEDLTGTFLYSQAPASSGQDQADNSAQLDPRGHATWGDYVIGVFDQSDQPFAGSFGNDYIAGGLADDMIFGEMGTDTIQGDGSIDYVAHRFDQTTGLLDPAVPAAPGRVTAYRTPGGALDPTGPLTVYSSFDVPATGP